MTGALLCGLTDERKIVIGGSTLICCGAHARDALATLVPAECAWLISWGCAGALAPDLKIGDLLVASSVTTMDGSVFQADAAWSRAIMAKTGAMSRPFFSAATEVAATATARAALHKQFSVDVVDEESFAIATLAKARNIRWAGLRSISDTAAETLPPAAVDPLATNPDGSPNIGEEIGDLFLDPAQDGALITVTDGFNKSMDALRAAYHVLGPEFGFPS